MVLAPEELDAKSAPELRDAVASLFASGVRHLVIDMGPVTFIDSSGLGALIALTKRANTLDVDLRLRNIGEKPMATLRMSGASSVLPIERPGR